MTRTFPFVHKHLIKQIESLNINKKKKVLKTWSRASTIVPIMIGHVRHAVTICSRVLKSLGFQTFKDLSYLGSMQYCKGIIMD